MPLTVVIRRRSRRRRRWPIYAVAILLAVGLSAPFWGVGFFRDDLIEAVSFRIDRPTEIEKLKIQFIPSPALVAHDVRIGHPEFNVRADRVTIEINLAQLSQRVVDVTSIEVEGLVCSVPDQPGELAREIKALELQPSRGSGKWSGVVRRAYADDARVVYADRDDTLLAGHVEVRDLLENKITLHVDAAAPVAGKAATLLGDASFIRQPDRTPSLAIEGRAALNDTESNTFVDEDIVPNTQVDFAQIEFERADANSMSIVLNGNTYPASAEAVDIAAIIGAFSATAVTHEGGIDIHVAEWRAEGFEFAGDTSIADDGAVTTVVTKGSANAAGIRAYFRWRPLAGYTVDPSADAQLNVTDLRFQRSPNRGLSLLGGTATFNGVDLLVENGAHAFSGFSGEIAIANNVITLNKIEGDELNIAGTVAPEFDENAYRFALNGEAKLSRERLSGFVNMEYTKEASGRIQFDKLEGTFTAGGGIPDDLLLEGKLVAGHFEIESPQWSDTLDNVDLTFDAHTDRIGTAGTAQSVMLGKVTADGTYFSTENRWNGDVSADFSAVSLPGLEGKTREVTLGIFQELGRSDLEVNVAIPNGESDRVLIDLARRGSGPTLVAAIHATRTEDVWTLGGVDATANLSSRVLDPLLPNSITTDGPMGVQFTRVTDDHRFQADLDLNEVNVALGDNLVKVPGDVFAISINGVADDDLWAADIIDAKILGTHIRGTLAQERFLVENLDLDVATLAPLLREGGTASGHITGTIRTNPADVSLNLQQVHIAITDDLVANNIDGALRVTGGGIETDELRVKAANSEFTLSLREANGRWQGGIEGSQVDANALIQFFNEYRALTDDEPRLTAAIPSASESAGRSLLSPSESATGFSQPILETPIVDSPSTLEGEFNVVIGSLLYRNATLSNVRTRMVASGGNYAANDLTFAQNDGTASGNVRISRGEAPYGNRLIADLVLDGVDAGGIDDLVFEEPRNLKGALSGDVLLDMPIDADGVVLGGINGHLNIRGSDGTLGSLGFANAILFVFKTTEILFLRSPFGDGGLSYTDLKGKATIVDGVVTLGNFENDIYTEAITLERPSYRMSAIGWIDLGKWDSEVVVHMQPLSSVADAARIFKIDDVEAINSRGGIRIYMSGPPDDPKTKIGFGGPVNAITNEIRSGVKSVQNLVKDQIVEGIGGLLRGLLER